MCAVLQSNDIKQYGLPPVKDTNLNLLMSITLRNIAQIALERQKVTRAPRTHRLLIAVFKKPDVLNWIHIVRIRFHEG